MNQLLDYQLYASLPWPYTGLFIFLGAALGSFLNLLASRWPAAQIAKNDSEARFWLSLRGVNVPAGCEKPARPLMGGRSACPTCDTPIPAFHNIPLVSWLLLRGKTRCCGTSIKVRYLAYEVFGAACFAFCAYFVGPTVYGLILGTFIMVMSLCVVMDMTDSFVPDTLLWIGSGLAILLSYSSNHWVTPIDAVQGYLMTLLAIAAGKTLYISLCKSDPLGGADLQLFAICAAFLGMESFLIALVLSFLMVAVTEPIRRRFVSPGIFGELISKRSMPLAPPLLSAAAIMMVIQVAV
ncbi:prepilin peptidase [Pseudomonas aeruginosa]